MNDASGSIKPLTALQTCLTERRVADGFRLLDEILRKDARLEPASADAIPILFCLAQYVDLGYRDTAFLESCWRAFDGVDRSTLSVAEFLQLRMVEAFLSMKEQRFLHAICLIKTATELVSFMPPYFSFVAHFWLGRAQRLAGDFEESLTSIRAAHALGVHMKATKLVAVAKIHESWLVFHKGEGDVALRLLDEAEKELRPTGHALSLANIHAARGRFFRSAGRYSDALKHFERSIEIYSINHPGHTNLARAFVNAAYIKRLLALELRPKLRGSPSSASTHKLMLKLAREALVLLQRAADIYSQHQHQAGTGAVLVNMGYLYLESGDIEQAALEASKAHQLGEVKADSVLMARAGILHASVELAFCEEQLEEVPGGDGHAILAAKHADHAIALASQTQNRRLLAAAFIVRGLVAADEANQEWLLAKDYATKARTLLDDQDRDHLYRELEELNLKIMRSTVVSETFRAWCDGDLAGKSFQQVQEEFASIILPRVWVKLDRKVSRVAVELSISPKKIRRILRAARYMDGSRST